MGVTAHFYAFDEKWFNSSFKRKIDIDFLIDGKIIDEEGFVNKEFDSKVFRIESPIGSNKQWYNNIAAETVYEYIRGSLPEEVRIKTDEIYNLLFFRTDEIRDHSNIKAPLIETEHRIYNPEIMFHVLKENPDLSGFKDIFEKAVKKWPSETREILNLDNMDDFYTFESWVNQWVSLFQKVKSIKEGLSLYIFIWF